MGNEYRHFIKDITRVDLDDICTDWQWLLEGKYKPLMVSNFGDLFLVDKDEAIHWLDTGNGQLQKIADNISQFYVALEASNNLDEWFLASLGLELVKRGMILNESQVYSYKVMPMLSGNYSVDNFEMTDISVHFSLTGQFCEQIKDLPAGTKIDRVILLTGRKERR